jgi:hypothetical protein
MPTSAIHRTDECFGVLAGLIEGGEGVTGMAE